MALLRQRVGRPARGHRHEPGAVGQTQRARSVGLPEGCADAIADAHEQPHRRVAAALLAATGLTPLSGTSSIDARRQGGVASRLPPALRCSRTVAARQAV